MAFQPPNEPGDLVHPKYRADIDGLRAIAVLSVVGFHAFPTWVKGGFIGVDIFFVISGFLISTIIFQSLQRGSFGFAEFYSRRIRRIFPALLVVLVASFAFGWIALLPHEYKQLGKHIAGGAGFVSNFVMWSESGYFDDAADTKPLLHLWSLGIEEQFYIVWPLLLWLSWKRRLNLLAVALAVGVISFALNVYDAGTDVLAAFYEPQSRFWELMTGSVLAYLMRHGRGVAPPEPASRGLKAWLHRQIHAPEAHGPNGKTLRDIQSALGAALIAVGLFVITKDKLFPGWWALLPTVGAALLILAGAQARFNAAVLSNRVLVWIGLISFPLYLWHWPLLSFARIVEGETPSRELRVAAVLVSIVLAWLTYALIEKPIRSGKHGQSKAIILFMLMLVVGGVGYGGYRFDGMAFRLAKAAGLAESEASVSNTFDCGADLPKGSFCQRTATPKIAVIGDSHSLALWQGLVSSGDKAFGQTINIGRGGCLPALGAEFGGTAAHAGGCETAMATVIRTIAENPSIEFVSLSTYSRTIERSSDDVLERILQGYNETIRRLNALGKKVVFVIDQPTLKHSAKICENSPIELRNALVKKKKFCGGTTPDDLEPHPRYDSFVARLKAENAGVLFYDPTAIFCEREGSCKVSDPSGLLYADSHHLSARGGSLVAKGLIGFLGQQAR